MRSRSAAFALAGALLAGACLVPDVDFVDDVPSGSAGTNRGGSQGSSGSSNGDAGQSSEGGEPASGTGGVQIKGGSSSGGTAQGGNASAGQGQGGSPTPSDIPELQICPNVEATSCDDFETPPSNVWPSGTEPAASTDAPSGNNVLVLSDRVEIVATGEARSISLWLRFSSYADKLFVALPQGGDRLGLGMEEQRLRWLHAQQAIVDIDGIRAPIQDNLTQLLPDNTWLCLELKIASPSELHGRLVVPGHAAFELPVLDTEATTGHDDEWNLQLTNWNVDGGMISIGQDGATLEIDDLLVGPYDIRTVCDRYLSAVH